MKTTPFSLRNSLILAAFLLNLTPFQIAQAGPGTNPVITITAPTTSFNAVITNTTIHVTASNGITAANVTVDPSTTVDEYNFNCAQTDSNTVDCTIAIISSGNLTMKAVDNLSNSSTQSQNGYTVTNLLTNPDAETNNMNGWTVTGNGGNGWSTNFDGLVHSGSHSFQTSYYWDTRYQMVSLASSGYTNDQIDYQGRSITFSEWIATRGDQGGQYYLNWELLGADDNPSNPIATFSSGSEGSPNFLNSGVNWFQVSHTFSNFPPGVRYIYFEDGGRDRSGWAGDYGTHFDDAFVTVSNPPYIVNGGNPGSLPTVGTASVSLPTVTLTNNDGNADFAATENIELTINTTNYSGVEFDQSVGPGNLTIAGTCGDTSASSVTYPNAQTADVTVTGAPGACTTNGNAITISGLKVQTTASQAAAGAYALIRALNKTTRPSGTGVNTDDTVNVSIATGALQTATLRPNSFTLGNNVIAIAQFTPPASLGVGSTDIINITLPAGFNVSAVVASSGSCSTMDGTFATSAAGQVVSITRSGGTTTTAGATQICTIAGVRNPTATGVTATGNIDVTTGAAQDRFSGTTPGVFIITAGGGYNNSSNSGGGSSGTPYNLGLNGSQQTEGTTSSNPIPYNPWASIGSQQTQATTSVTPNPFNSGLSSTQQTQTATQVMTQTMEMTQQTNTVPFTDISGHWAQQYIDTLYEKGVVGGETPTLFFPDRNLTRAEMTKIALLSFGDNVDMTNTATGFSDVSSSDWFAPYVAAAQKANIVGGYPDGTFHPNDPVTRAEALKILLTAAAQSKNIQFNAPVAPFTDIDQTAWYAPYVNYAYSNGIVSGETSTMFDPNGDVTRGEMAKMAVKAMSL